MSSVVKSKKTLEIEGIMQEWDSHELRVEQEQFCDYVDTMVQAGQLGFRVTEGGYLHKVSVRGNVVDILSVEKPVALSVCRNPEGRRGKEELTEEEKQENSERARAYSERVTRQTIIDLCNLNFSASSYFLTLTYARNEQDIDAARQDFRKFIQKLKRMAKKAGRTLKYLAVVEFQQRGAIHYHVILDGVPDHWAEKISVPVVRVKYGVEGQRKSFRKLFFLDADGVSRVFHAGCLTVSFLSLTGRARQYFELNVLGWLQNRGLELRDLCFDNQEVSCLSSVWGHGFVDYQGLDEVGNVGAYLGKYMSKKFDERLRGRRAWSCSRNLEREARVSYSAGVFQKFQYVPMRDLMDYQMYQGENKYLGAYQKVRLVFRRDIDYQAYLEEIFRVRRLQLVRKEGVSYVGDLNYPESAFSPLDYREVMDYFSHLGWLQEQLAEVF